MDNLLSKCICAFCTTATNNKAVGFLQAFNLEFIDNPLFQLKNDEDNYSASENQTSLPDNWSICVNCLPQVQLLLGSKQKVDKVDSEVRYLQKRILVEMKSLLEEMDKMCGDMVMIEGILRSNPAIPSTPSKRIYVKKKKRGRKSTKKLTDGDNMMVQFREKIFNVLKDIQIFRMEASTKLLLKSFSSEEKTPPIIPEPQMTSASSSKPSSSPCPSKPEQLPVPKLKIETGDDDDQVEMEAEDSFFSSPPTSPPPNVPLPSPILPPTDSIPPPTAIIDEEVQGQPGKRKRKSIPLQKPAEYEGLDLTSSSDEEIPEDELDLEFDPQQRITVKITKKNSKYSTFRKALISRIQDRATIATSASLPSDPSDPRRPFSIKYNKVTNEFSLNEIPFHCLDSPEKNLQCSKCDYTVDPTKISKRGGQGRNKERNIEDWIFDHILAKHLHIYDCKICGNTYQTGTKFNEHLQAHDLQFVCDICQKPLSSGGTLKAHKWTHLSAEEKRDPEFESWMPSEARNVELRFQCETCGKGFKQGKNLREHEITHLDKGEREKVMCTDCGKQVFEKNLKIHQTKWCEKVKGPPKGLDCEVCGENVRTLRELHEHLKERHPGERIWGCQVCGGKFKTKWHLRIHEGIHKEGFKYVCEWCGRGFKQNRNRKRHEGTCKRAGGVRGGGSRQAEGLCQNGSSEMSN